MPESASKNGWTRVAFGEIAEHIAERVEPTPDDGETYVGLEHLDSGSLTVRRWGSEVALIGTKLRMRKGDILFARRNAYLRRVALAPHDGLFSAHGMVLRARPHVVLPEFLPFFMQSDLFMDRAEQISVGSLSPTINWGTLKEQQFALPPLEEQRRLVDILEATRGLEERAFALVGSLQVTRESWLQQEFSVLARKWPEKVASDLMERITVGIVVKPADLYVSSGQGVPALRSLNVLPNKVFMEDLVYISREGHEEHDKSRLTPGDLVIVRSGRPGDAAVVPADAGELNCIDLIICGPSSELDPHFLCAALNSTFGRQQFAAGTAGTAQKHFNVGAFKQLRIPVPPTDVQARFVDRLHDFTQSVADAEQRLFDVRALRSALMRRVFAA